MRGRGKLSSAAELGTVSVMPGRPIEPPEDLTPEEEVDWRQITLPLPSGWLRAEHVPIMRELVRHIGYSRQLAIAMSGFKIDQNLGNLESLDALQRMHARQSKAIGDLAARLRLTPASLAQSRKYENASKTTSGDASKPWADWEGYHQMDRALLLRPGRQIDRPEDRPG